MAIPKFFKGINLAGQRAINGADASAPTDFVTLQQMQAFVRGLNWKPAARAMATGSINLAAPGASIDGVAMNVGERFVAPAQGTGAQGGIYIWNGAAVAATRAPDMDSSTEFVGAAVYVTEGTVNEDTMWTQTIDPFVMDTTTPVFEQFGGGGTTYTAGDGLDLDGSEFKVVQGPGIIADGTNTRVDPSVVVRVFQADCVVTTNPQTFIHGLGKRPLVMILEGEDVTYPDVTVDTTEIVVDIGVAPTAAQYRVIAVG